MQIGCQSLEAIRVQHGMDAIHFNLILLVVSLIREGGNTVRDRIDSGWNEAGCVPGCKEV